VQRRTLLEAQAQRRAAGELLVRACLADAVYKRYFKQPLSAVERLLLDPESVTELRLEAAGPLARQLRVKLRALYNPRCCRGCGKRPLTPVPCPQCRSVYFCSQQCMIRDDSERSTSHSHECSLAQ
jgi:hypothetical protein